MAESYREPRHGGAPHGYSRDMSDEASQGGAPSADGGPRLHIDSDWKAQAQAEKERLAEREAARGQTANGGEAGGELPPADFRTLVATLASQAMMGLGAYGDPQTGRVVIDVVGAQFAIDLLGVLEEKTKGNLSAEESAELTEVLAHLRARFVQIARLVASQMQREQAGVAAGAAEGPGVVGSIGRAGGSEAPAQRPSGLIIPE